MNSAAQIHLVELGLTGKFVEGFPRSRFCDSLSLRRFDACVMQQRQRERGTAA